MRARLTISSNCASCTARVSRTRKLWQRRAEIFSDADEASWLGWLDLPTASPEVAIGSASVREAVRSHDSDSVVVIGMGGSSLWPDVLGQTFKDAERDGAGRKRDLRVIDTTVPDAIETAMASLDLERCLFLIASKSGSTIEPNAIFELIHARLAEKVGAEAAGRHFVAITDPGSALEARAAELGFLGTALGRPDVGGRFSALSPFGLLPAEAMGLDPEALQARARLMSAACAGFVSPDHNPGVALGLALGSLACQGRDKLTLSASPEIASFTGWIEQLVAESTGKHGQGVVPIAGEPLEAPERYGADRVFVDLALADAASTAGAEPASERESKLAALEAAGHPVIRIRIAEALDLVQEVFRWEIATAVIGAVLELNPFDQPDVEAAKLASRELIDQAGAGGALPSREADLEIDGAKLFVAPALGAAATSSADDPAALLGALVGSLAAGDTFVINTFLEDTDATRGALEALRSAVGRAKQVATTLDFGPRYLHSTGQLQKGGPNRLVGLQLWQSAASRKAGMLQIPGMGGDFGLLAEAQAAGDFSVLCERDRRMIGIDVGPDPAATLSRLSAWIEGALGQT